MKLTADKIFINAKAYTLEAEGVIKEAIVIKDGKFVFVGTTEEALERYEAKEVIDLEGKTVLPGMGDSHLHFFAFCQTFTTVDLGGAKSKKEAIEKLKMHYKGRPYLPKSFKDDNHIEEIQGVYVPFWMFDGKASGEASYKATTSKVYEKGDEEITETRHYEVSRAGSIGFEKIPVDASSKMPDDHMDSIEPYDYSGLKEFSTAYLPGFLADKYDVSVKDSQKRADTRCASTLEDALRGTVTGYDSCTLEHKQIDLKRGKVHYALLPVWMLHTKWNGQDFLFAMNGQTGKMVGDLPTSKGKFWGLFAAIAAPMTVVLTIILMLS